MVVGVGWCVGNHHYEGFTRVPCEFRSSSYAACSSAVAACSWSAQSSSSTTPNPPLTTQNSRPTSFLSPSTASRTTLPPPPRRFPRAGRVVPIRWPVDRESRMYTVRSRLARIQGVDLSMRFRRTRPDTRAGRARIRRWRRGPPTGSLPPLLPPEPRPDSVARDVGHLAAQRSKMSIYMRYEMAAPRPPS